MLEFEGEFCIIVCCSLSERTFLKFGCRHLECCAGLFLLGKSAVGICQIEPCVPLLLALRIILQVFLERCHGTVVSAG